MPKIWNEQNRPVLHFTPERNWINDPNGLVWYEGEYHLFFQYNPFGTQWGNMSWGHAVSEDLVQWKELPVAIPATDQYFIFSGSSVVGPLEKANGESPSLHAFYTAHYLEDKRQVQHLAVSKDNGRSWAEHDGNPILQSEHRDFRDPKVFWHPETGRWVMVVALAMERLVEIYTTENGVNWDLQSEFGKQGRVAGQWECPDLVPVPSDDLTETHWILKVDVDANTIGSSSGCQYFIGHFDGKEFIPYAGQEFGHLADFGGDFYAAMTWANLPPKHQFPVWLAWHSNHLAGKAYPTDPWRGCMTIPRELFLFQDLGEWRLGQRPIAEVQRLFQKNLKASYAVSPHKPLSFTQNISSQCIRISISPTQLDWDALRVNLVDEDQNEVEIIADRTNGQIRIDKSRLRDDIHPVLNESHITEYSFVDANAFLQLILDGPSLELYVDGGKRVFSEMVFLGEEVSLRMSASMDKASCTVDIDLISGNHLLTSESA